MLLYSSIPIPNKTKCTEDVVVVIAAAIKEDDRQTVRGLTSAHGQSKETIRRILSEDLGLVK
jgi:hypothetical protein